MMLKKYPVVLIIVGAFLINLFFTLSDSPSQVLFEYPAENGCKAVVIKVDDISIWERDLSVEIKIERNYTKEASYSIKDEDSYLKGFSFAISRIYQGFDTQNFRGDSTWIDVSKESVEAYQEIPRTVDDTWAYEDFGQPVTYSQIRFSQPGCLNRELRYYTLPHIFTLPKIRETDKSIELIVQ